MKKEISFDLKLISIILLVLLIIVFFSGVLKAHMMSYDCFPSNGSISRLDYINVVSVILIVITIFEVIINVLIIIKSQMFIKILFTIITIMFSVMFVFELYTLRDKFVCGKEEVSLLEK